RYLRVSNLQPSRRSTGHIHQLAASKLQPSRTRANPVHPPTHPRPTTDTDSAELDTVLLDQVTRGKPHTYPHQSQPLPVSPRTLLLAVHFPQSIDEFPADTDLTSTFL
ncbi:hypothetical protein ATANTOWER_031288, partial [Ataeniobius toweri]|nr:hypothetical protein [Ataeniobius toweri]